mgnify:CR=1 FL=1
MINQVVNLTDYLALLEGEMFRIKDDIFTVKNHTLYCYIGATTHKINVFNCRDCNLTYWEIELYKVCKRLRLL